MKGDTMRMVLRSIGVGIGVTLLCAIAFSAAVDKGNTGYQELGGFRFYTEGALGKIKVHMYVNNRIDGDYFQIVSRWIDSRLFGKVDEVFIDIHSAGGAVFEGVKAANEIRRWQAKGIKVTTFTRSLAASAAAYVFLYGDKRYIAPGAWLMHHSIQLPMFYTPTESEKQALSRLQHQLNMAWIDRIQIKSPAIYAYFYIPFGSDRQVWINHIWAKIYGLAEVKE